MNARDLLLKQFQLMYDTTAMNRDGVSAQDSLVQPPGGANCANWVLGHRAYHAGQLALGRRLAGLEGAVRGPGQTDES